MKLRSKEQGFTLIELLLVVVIIGILLAVIVPRAWRANIDAKYGLVRQNATELASIGVQWAENQLNGQNSSNIAGHGSSAQLVDYLAYITSEQGRVAGDDAQNIWIADDDNDYNGWINASGEMSFDDSVRCVGEDCGVSPSGPAKEMMPVDRRARNPFNGMDVFDDSNFPEEETAIPGAIGSGYYADGELGDDWYYFGLRFQGTDNDNNDADSDYHADMAGDSLNALRAGVFMARAQKTN